MLGPATSPDHHLRSLDYAIPDVKSNAVLCVSRFLGLSRTCPLIPGGPYNRTTPNGQILSDVGRVVRYVTRHVPLFFLFSDEGE